MINSRTTRLRRRTLRRTEVANCAAQFAAAFGAPEWGEILGRCHDLGKYSKVFQRLLRRPDPDAGAQEGSAGRVDHSTFGARYVCDIGGKHKGQILAYCIAGHHRFENRSDVQNSSAVFH